MIDMPNIVTAQELADFMKLRDVEGNPLTLGVDTDPTLAEMETILDDISVCP